MKNRITSFLSLLFVRGELFANEAKEAAAEFFFVNQFTPDKENWVQLSPFGDFANRDRKGNPVIQRFRKEDAEEISNAFGGIGRKISQPLGMPFYVGHPDHPSFAGKPGHCDTSSKGRGKVMEVRHDAACAVCNEFANTKEQPCQDHGLFVKMDWNPHGTEIIANQEYHGHSVNWSAVPDGKENGIAIYRPIRVKSTGFTNEPAIPVAPASLANEKEIDPSSAPIIPGWVKLLAGFKSDEEVTQEQVEAAIKKAHPLKPEEMSNEAETAALCELGLLLLANVDAAPKSETEADDEGRKDLVSWLHSLVGTDPAQGVEPLKTALTDKVTKAGAIDRVKKTRAAVEAAHKSHEKAHAALQEQIGNAQTALQEHKKSAATFLVNQLVKSGHILQADQEAKITELASAEDLFTKAEQLGNASPLIKTKAKTADLGNSRVSLKEQGSRTAEFSELMAKRAEQFPNESYQERFDAVGKSPQGVQLLAQMDRPGSKE